MWKVYNMRYVQTCKVQNSPVSNNTELQSRNGIPLHSMDCASLGGGWINVCACTRLSSSHKQFHFSQSRPITTTSPKQTAKRDSFWCEDAIFKLSKYSCPTYNYKTWNTVFWSRISQMHSCLDISEESTHHHSQRKQNLYIGKLVVHVTQIF